jgi:hypothetical protein
MNIMQEIAEIKSENEMKRKWNEERMRRGNVNRNE